MNALFRMLRKSAVLSACLYFLTPLAAQPHLEWSRTYALNRAKTNQPLSLVVAPDNSIIVSGTSANLNADLDYLTIKYASNGDEQWVQRFDNAGANDTLRRQVIGPQGNVTITGTTKTVSYDPAGNQLWAEPYAGRDLAVDSDHIYIAGFSEIDYATAKLRANNGANIWTRLWNSIYNLTDVAQVLTIDPDGNVYVAGSVTWWCPRIFLCYELLTSLKYGLAGNLITSRDTSFLDGGGHRGIYLVRLLYDESGRITATGEENNYGFHFWTYSYTTRLEESWWWSLDRDDGSGFYGRERDAIADRHGNLYLTGLIEYPASRITTIKLKPDGHKAWRAQYSSSVEGLHEGMAVTQDAAGNTYVAGYGPSEYGNEFLILNDFFLLKYDSDGNQKWVHRYDGPSHGNDIATDIALDRAGNIYVTGFSATAEGGSEFVTLKFAQLPKAEVLPTGAVRLQFITDPGSDYTLERTTDFTDWTDLLTKTADATGFVEFEDQEAARLPYRFYRGKIPSP